LCGALKFGQVIGLRAIVGAAQAGLDHPEVSALGSQELHQIVRSVLGHRIPEQGSILQRAAA
jgi:hypothetical protein